MRLDPRHRHTADQTLQASLVLPVDDVGLQSLSQTFHGQLLSAHASVLDHPQQTFPFPAVRLARFLNADWRRAHRAGTSFPFGSGSNRVSLIPESRVLLEPMTGSAERHSTWVESVVGLERKVVGE
jgi:hypothetical protein